ncbi:MAG: RluA family pseudouridine synthase [Nannocystaceae bacterium]
MDADELRILYEDDAVVVVHKPTGMSSHRGWTRDGPVALQTTRDLVGQHLFLAHRLDRGTSGALVFTKSREAVRSVCDAFEAGHAVKRYVGVCRGRLQRDEQFVDHDIPGTERGPRIPAQTWVRALEHPSEERCSFFEALPITGRLHQIRRHLKHLSHPIVGDVRYGDGRVNRHYRRSYDLHRLALHAWSIEFPHPIDQRPLRVCAPLPPELVSMLSAIRCSDDAYTHQRPWPNAEEDRRARRTPLPVRGAEP